MRIAIVGPFTGASLAGAFDFAPDAGVLPHGYSGAPLMTVLAAALAERGHEIGVITTDTAAAIQQLEPYRIYRARQVIAYFCPQRKRSFRSSEGRRGRAVDLFAYERECLVAAIKDFAPEVIHAHWTYEFVWAALDSGRPTVATAHDSPVKVVRYMPNLYRAARYLMARRILPRCKHLTAVSPDLARDIQRMAKAQVAVVSNPIPSAIMLAAGCTDASFRKKTLVMVLNGWVRFKNGTGALRAFKQARRQDPALRLVCFGADFEPGGLAQEWARTNGLDEGVDFRGPVANRIIIEEMQSATALFHPSLVEACSVTIAEAMSLGLPVIAGRETGGVAWQLDDGRSGVLVDATDAGDLAKGIIALTTDMEKWRAISTSSRIRARNLFSTDRIVDQYQALYAAAARNP